MTKQEEAYLKQLDEFEAFLEANGSGHSLTISEIRGLLNKQAVGALNNIAVSDTEIIRMLGDLVELRLVKAAAIPNLTDQYKYRFLTKHPIGHYAQGLKDKEKREKEELLLKRQIENLDASIRLADSAIITNKNIIDFNEGQRGFNETTKWIAVSAVVIAFIGLIPSVGGMFIDKADDTLQLQAIQKELSIIARHQDKVYNYRQMPALHDSSGRQKR